MSLFKFAIMGAGNIARKFCEAAKLVPGCQVTAIASKSQDRADAFARDMGIELSYGDYSAMLDAVRPDAVYIATTCDSHFALSMLCIERGVPVLCEKAMFVSGSDARACFSAARQRGVFCMEALWSRFLPANLTARRWVQEGCIGTPVMADMGIGFRAPSSPDNRYFSPALGGGACNDLTVYGYMIVPYVLGRPVVRCHAEATRGDTEVDVTEMVLLRLASGVPAAIRASFMAPVGEKLTIIGTAGKIEVPHAHYASEATLFDAEGHEAEHYVDTVTQNGFTYEISEVMRCVREGLPESPTVPQADTLACAALFDQIHASEIV